MDGNPVDQPDIRIMDICRWARENPRWWFARDCLLPPHEYQEFLDAGDLSASAIRDFAQAQQVAPRIVVGRPQRNERVPRSHLNDLKKSIRWSTDKW